MSDGQADLNRRKILKTIGAGAAGVAGLAGTTMTTGATNDLEIETAYAHPTRVRPGEQFRLLAEYDEDLGRDLFFEVYYCEDADCEETTFVEELTDSTEFLRASYDESGTYEATAIVYYADEEGRGKAKDFQFEVAEEDELNFPEAEISVDQRVEVGEEVTLDGSGSSWEPGGSISGRISSYLWSGDVYASGERTAVTFDEPGTKTVSLRVGATADKEDFDLLLHEDPTATATAEVEIEVVDESGDPEAVIDVSDDEPEPGDTVTFDGSESTSPNGDIVSYEWAFEHEELGKSFDVGVEVTQSWDEEGEVRVGLRVTDENGETASETDYSIDVEEDDVWDPFG